MILDLAVDTHCGLMRWRQIKLAEKSVGFCREAAIYDSPGLRPISANLREILQPKECILSRRDQTKVARLRKAYVATAEGGCANPWLSGAP